MSPNSDDKTPRSSMKHDATLLCCRLQVAGRVNVENLSNRNHFTAYQQIRDREDNENLDGSQAIFQGKTIF